VPGIMLAAKAIVDYFLLLQPYSNCLAMHPILAAVLAESLLKLRRNRHTNSLSSPSGFLDVAISLLGI